MKKPYIICHMMISLDGRIDCAMTEHLPGVDDYYQTLEALSVPTTVTGRVTAQLEMALPGTFQAKDPTPVGREAFSKKAGRLRNRCGYPRQAPVAGRRRGGKAPADPHQPADAPGVPGRSGQPEHLLDRRGRGADRSGPGRRDSGGGVRRRAHGHCGRLRHQHRIPGCRAAG